MGPLQRQDGVRLCSWGHDARVPFSEISKIWPEVKIKLYKSRAAHSRVPAEFIYWEITFSLIVMDAVLRNWSIQPWNDS